MPDISLSKNHSLTLEEAQGKIGDIINDIQSDFGNLVSSIDWNNDKTVADVSGKGFNGKFKISEDSVGIDVDLKFFAKPLKGKVESKIEERMERYFG